MKKLLMILPLVFLFCFTFSCTKQAEVSALSDEDVAAIKTTLDDYAQAVLADDTEAILEFFTEDSTAIAEGASIQGREAMKEEVFSKLTYTALNQTIEEIDGRDDLAYVWGALSATMGPKGAPETVQSYTGKFLYILRKQEDGSWLIAISIAVGD